MRLLHLVPSVDPQGGGVIEGVRRIHDALTALGHSGDVVSLDSPDAPCVRDYPGTVVATGPSISSYGYNERLLPWLKAHAGGYDAVIVNGLWQYVGLAARRALHGSGTPYFVYSHGMLDPWFKRRYPLKHLKKWLYWPGASTACCATHLPWSSPARRNACWLGSRSGSIAAARWWAPTAPARHRGMHSACRKSSSRPSPSCVTSAFCSSSAASTKRRAATC